MQIIEIELSKITPYEANAKKHSREQIRNVAESIKEFGWQQPIVLDKDYVIIIGHCRFRAAKRLRLKTVPCTIAEGLSEEEVKKLRLIDNKTNESEWDLDLLLTEIKGLDFSAFEIDWGVLEDKPTEAEVNEDDFDIDKALPKIAKSKVGEIYQLGRHRLMCGDSTSESDVEKLMNGKEVDLFLTDPPYNEAIGKRGKKYKEQGGYECGMDDRTIMNDDMDSHAYLEFLIKAFSNASKYIKLGASFYVWHASREAHNVQIALEECNLTVKQQLIWNKNTFTLGRQDYQWKHEPCFYGWKEGASHSWYNDRKQTTVMDFDKPIKSELHPTMKPIKLFDYQIKNSSKQNSDIEETIILDLFGGSGTTLVCCEQNNRTCYMMEFDPKYVDVIITRWEALTGKKALKID